MQTPEPELELVHDFACHTGDCCPKILKDNEAPPAKRYVITDDHGGSIQLSDEQLVAILCTDPTTLNL